MYAKECSIFRKMKRKDWEGYAPPPPTARVAPRIRSRCAEVVVPREEEEVERVDKPLAAPSVDDFVGVELEII